MTSLFNNLLISSPNGGGLYLAQAGELVQLDGLDTTGFGISNGTLVRGYQPDFLSISQKDSVQFFSKSEAFDDIHDVLNANDNIYVVSTGANQILELNKKGELLRNWKFPGERDSWHINCLGIWKGRLVFSAFGEFFTHREYKGATLNSGFVQDLETGERLVEGLSQPHSLTIIENNLLLADSEKKRIVEYNSDGKFLRERTFDGYPRGICYSNGVIYVGLSCSRNAPDTEMANSMVIALDESNFQEIERLEVPRKEIYELAHLESSEELLKVVIASSIASSHFQRNMVDSNSEPALSLEDYKNMEARLSNMEEKENLLGLELDRATKELDTATAKAHSLQEELRQVSEEVNRNQELLAASQQARATLETTTHNLQEELHRVSEEVKKSQALLTASKQACALVEAAAAEKARGYEDKQAELEEKIASIINDKDWELRQLRAELAALYDSRSWRLMAPVRKVSEIIGLNKLRRSSIRPLIWRFARAGFHRIPGDVYLKCKMKNFAFRHFSWLLGRESIYHNWAGTNGENGANQSQLLLLPPLLKGAGKKAPFDFPLSENPTVSIVIPVYGKSDFTYNCLLSIYENRPNLSFEIVVVNDCSKDDTLEMLKTIGGLTVISNDTNLGFLRTANRGAKAAQGKYLLFLNNDTLVHPGWLDELVAVLESRPDIGLVGSQLIYANGLLQESGCLICQDGSSLPLGRLQSPLAPEFSYFREVDFCSGASILVRKEEFDIVGGFDEVYAPAYYEDPDLAFKLRAIEKKTFVQPLSKVTHFENVSYGEKAYGDLTSKNRNTFFSKWQSIFPSLLYPDVANYHENRRYPRQRVLYIDALVPVPDRGAGSVDAYYFMKFLVEAGYDVVFYGEHTPDFVEKYTPMIQRLGVECLYRPHIGIDKYLEQHGASFSFVLMARVYQAAAFQKLIEKFCTNAAYVFNTVDIHFLREGRQAEIEGSAMLRKQAEHTKKAELGFMEKANATIVISAEEKVLLESEYGQTRIHHIPLIREIYGSKRPYEDRKDIVFIGSAHLPNVDGVLYFHQEIFPLIKAKLPDINLIVIGEELRGALKGEPGYSALANDANVRLVGFVENLEDYFDHVRVMVAPLRYGSGVKGKIATSLSYGVPCVATKIGVEGMGLEHEINVLEAEGPEQFASELVRAYNDRPLWEALSRNGLDFMDREYSLEMGRSRLLSVMAAAMENHQTQLMNALDGENSLHITD
ncbi:hypothetical protein GCM10007860_09700 [Chitiniphilus shinanonensis]|uniref:Glycosyltransferase n=1 Tax=Chitiniphilus shinanonensis TaxID=553088 RepID=A0ABQ6BP76_9NEIS|nr:glycosyltransferase [Chitiniphilus shinanonensis]GLS03825.1 hypothetical protein GCM10007860_09700 [Chitiniphilus shinanonensis]